MISHITCRSPSSVGGRSLEALRHSHSSINTFSITSSSSEATTKTRYFLRKMFDSSWCPPFPHYTPYYTSQEPVARQFEGRLLPGRRLVELEKQLLGILLSESNHYSHVGAVSGLPASPFGLFVVRANPLSDLSFRCVAGHLKASLGKPRV